MRERPQGEIIELIAKTPDGDLACDFTIADEKARAGLGQGLSDGMIALHDIDDGVEVTFKPGAWESVQRYVDLESRCCSFLNLYAERTGDGVLLRVTGRPDALPFIREIFRGNVLGESPR
jgi:hypothetical protein